MSQEQDISQNRDFLKDLRYSPCADEFKVFDWKTGRFLEGMDIVKTLNRQNMLLEKCRKHRNLLIERLDEESIYEL